MSLSLSLSSVGWNLFSGTLLDILKLLPSICVCVRQLKSAEDEHSEYVRIASVREWITVYIENVVRCIKITRKTVTRQLWNRHFSVIFSCTLSCCRQTTQVGVDLNRYMSSTMSCLWDRTQNCGDLRFFYSKTSYL